MGLVVRCDSPYDSYDAFFCRGEGCVGIRFAHCRFSSELWGKEELILFIPSFLLSYTWVEISQGKVQRHDDDDDFHFLSPDDFFSSSPICLCIANDGCVKQFFFAFTYLVLPFVLKIVVYTYLFTHTLT